MQGDMAAKLHKMALGFAAGGGVVGLNITAIFFASILLLGYAALHSYYHILWMAVIGWFSYLIDYLCGAYLEDSKGNENRTKLIRNNRVVIFLILCAEVIYLAMFLFMHYSAELLFFTLLYPISVLLYSFPLRIPGIEGRIFRIKSIPYFKNIYISLVTASITLIPPILAGDSISAQALGFYILASMALFINTVFCDIPDVEQDRINRVSTFPTLLGKASSYNMLQVINGFMLAFSLIGFYGGILNFGMMLCGITLFVCNFISLVLAKVRYGSSSHDSFFYSVFLDLQLAMIFPPALLCSLFGW